MKLSKNFWLSEFTKSRTAIQLGIDNTPNEEETQNLKLLCENVLQPLRDWLAHSVNISSGYRNPLLGIGSKTSDHCKGKAADIDQDIYGENRAVDNTAVFNYIKEKLDFDQLIWEYGNDIKPDWVHVSYRKEGNRKQILRALKGGNYEEIS